MIFSSSIAFAKEKAIILATTTSTENSGLLDYIHPDFTQKTGIKVKVVAKGTGAALKMAMDGNADIVMAHAKNRELKFVEEGYGIDRHEFMHNDFIIVGPASDPADIYGMTDAASALSKIAKFKKTPFISRGDNSGTHIKEQQLWKNSTADLIEDNQDVMAEGQIKNVKSIRPKGRWYLSVGQGMAKTFGIAYEKNAYTIIDRGTFIALSDKYKLKIMVEGDPKLFNQYSIMAVNPKKYPHVKYKYSKKYIDWILSPSTLKMIANYKIKGEQLFFPEKMPD